MSARESQRPTAVLVTLLILFFLVAPVLYFLSVGPMVVQLDRGEISKPRFDSIYAPLIGLATTSMTFRGWVEWYVDYWRGKPEPLHHY